MTPDPYGDADLVTVTNVDEDRRVVFDAHNIINGGPDRVLTNVLYFRTAHEFTQHLETTGFTQIEVAGEWDRGPFTDTSPLLVVRAARG